MDVDQSLVFRLSFLSSGPTESWQADRLSRRVWLVFRLSSTADVNNREEPSWPQPRCHPRSRPVVSFIESYLLVSPPLHHALLLQYRYQLSIFARAPLSFDRRRHSFPVGVLTRNHSCLMALGLLGFQSLFPSAKRHIWPSDLRSTGSPLVWPGSEAHFFSTRFVRSPGAVFQPHLVEGKLDSLVKTLKDSLLETPLASVTSASRSVVAVFIIVKWIFGILLVATHYNRLQAEVLVVSVSKEERV